MNTFAVMFYLAAIVGLAGGTGGLILSMLRRSGFGVVVSVIEIAASLVMLVTLMRTGSRPESDLRIIGLFMIVSLLAGRALLRESKLFFKHFEREFLTHPGAPKADLTAADVIDP